VSLVKGCIILPDPSELHTRETSSKDQHGYVARSVARSYRATNYRLQRTTPGAAKFERLAACFLGFSRRVSRGIDKSNKAGMCFEINDWDSETHETHKDCDNRYTNDNRRGNEPLGQAALIFD
jgi:hypothetical protein